MARKPSLTPAAAKAAMAAGVKTAAIVNYEKYAAHPLPVTATKKEAKARAKAAPKAAVHRAAVRHAPAKRAPAKQAPGDQVALRPKGSAAAVAVRKTIVPRHPAVPSSVAVATRQKKP